MTPTPGIDSLEPRGMRPAQAAAYTGMAEDWLKRARIYGEVEGVAGPPFHRISERLILYYRDELDVWLDSFPANHNLAEEARVRKRVSGAG